MYDEQSLESYSLVCPKGEVAFRESRSRRSRVRRDLKSFSRCTNVRRRWSDRFKSVELPLFPGYVFCRLNPRFRLPLMTIPGVMSFRWHRKNSCAH